ncbi:MAG: prohibitin family protein [Ignavibacteriaceae bacterium]
MLFIIALLAAVVSLLIYINFKRRGVRAETPFALIGFVITSLIALMQCFTVIPAGHVGVVDFLGNVSENTLKSGVNMVNPMANVIKFSIKTQEVKESMNVPSKEGLSVQLEISLLFHLNPENAFDIYRSVGENYAEIILAPQFRSVVRGVTARYEAKALYTSEREGLAKQIESELANLVAKRGITLESAPLRQIILPAGLTTAIEEKLKAEQESQRMQFVLLKEQQEADRKRIEAQGVSDFQNIVSKGINDALLKWKGIEATEKLASSNNAKIVVIGSGKDGLPLILGGN